MSKKPIIGGIILAIIAIIIIFGEVINPDGSESIQNDNIVFHVTLADPALYDENGLYYHSITVEEGLYEFRFVANGDSPKTLSILLWQPVRDNKIFAFEYLLQGTLVEDEFSSWYVWDYLGMKGFYLDLSDLYLVLDGELPTDVEIIISPNGNYDGPVSIDLIKLD